MSGWFWAGFTWGLLFGAGATLLVLAIVVALTPVLTRLENRARVELERWLAELRRRDG